MSRTAAAGDDGPLAALMHGLESQVSRLSSTVEQLEARLARIEGAKAMPRDRRVITCRESDRIYRRREGTTATLWRSGVLPGRRQGRAIIVSAKRAEELLGTR